MKLFVTLAATLATKTFAASCGDFTEQAKCVDIDTSNMCVWSPEKAAVTTAVYTCQQNPQPASVCKASATVIDPASESCGTAATEAACKTKAGTCGWAISVPVSAKVPGKCWPATCGGYTETNCPKAPGRATATNGAGCNWKKAVTGTSTTFQCNADAGNTVAATKKLCTDTDASTTSCGLSANGGSACCKMGIKALGTSVTAGCYSNPIPPKSHATIAVLGTAAVTTAALLF